MFDPYDEEDEFEYLTEETCREATGHDLEYFIALTGIYGLHKEYKIIESEFQAKLINHQKVSIRIINTSLIKVYACTIFLHRPIIENDLLIAAQKGKNIGKKILAAQVEIAQSNGYRKMNIIALREKNEFVNDGEFNGYWLWGRYGYIMKPHYHDDFVINIQDHIKNLNDLQDKQNINLYKLLCHKEGSEIWRAIGYTWRGTFFLNVNSPSNIILTKAL